MDKEAQEEAIGKWIVNKQSDEELSKSSSEKEIADYKIILNELEGWSLPGVDKDVVYGSIKGTINKKSEAKVVSFNRPRVISIAAAVSLLVVGYFLLKPILFNPIVTIQTLAFQEEYVKLPNGSEIYMNANSKVTYNKDTWDTDKQVQLEGEAYFKVVKGSFAVHLGDEKVEVLGTEFNIRKREDFLAVDCFEGVVKVSMDQETHIDTLVANTGIRFRSDSIPERITIKGAEPSWRSANITRFRNRPLAEVFVSWEGQFGLDLEIVNVDINRKFNGILSHEEAEKSLAIICEAMGLSYERLSEDTYRVTK